MDVLNNPENPSPPVKWNWPAVHPEGRKFALIAGGITLVFALLGWDVLGWLMAGITLWVLAFFRDPVRAVPQGDNLIVSPADGLVTQIMTVSAPRELMDVGSLGSARFTRVSIFMSVFDVHINRAPISTKTS